MSGESLHDFVEAHCLDLRATMAEVDGLPAEQRLGYLFEQAGCTFHDRRRRLVATPAVRLCAVGGLPVHALADAGIGPAAMAGLGRESMGVAGAMSYLGLPGGSPQEAYRTVVADHGHHSVAHVASVSLLVAGVSCAAENEFNVQRDLVHLARVTQARTRVQSRPPVVVPHPSLVEHYAEAVREADLRRATAEAALGPDVEARSRLEALNLLHPAAKATAFLLTGSLRNLQKLLCAEDDPGKEDEYRRALRLVRVPLALLWPELFRPA